MKTLTLKKLLALLLIITFSTQNIMANNIFAVGDLKSLTDSIKSQASFIITIIEIFAGLLITGLVIYILIESQKEQPHVKGAIITAIVASVAALSLFAIQKTVFGF